MSNIIVRSVAVDIFETQVILVCGEWSELPGEAEKLLSEVTFADLTARIRRYVEVPTAKGIHFGLVGGISVIWMRPGETIGILLHETFHAVAHTLDSVDIPLSRDSEEVYAYLIEYIFCQLIKK